MMKKPIKGLILDLDDALYTPVSDWNLRWKAAWAHALQVHGINMPRDEAITMILELYRQHGHVQQALADRFGLDGWALHEAAAEHMDHTVIQTCVHTQAHFERYRNLPMVILTAGMTNWADRMLCHIGLDQVFPRNRRITLQDTNGRLKSHHEEPFYKASEHLGIPVDELAIADDSARNLVIPNRLGMTTIQIIHDHPQVEHPPHVDFRVEKAYHIFDLIEQGVMQWHKQPVTASRS